MCQLTGGGGAGAEVVCFAYLIDPSKNQRIPFVVHTGRIVSLGWQIDSVLKEIKVEH
jgi:hypothetical protein